MLLSTRSIHIVALISFVFFAGCSGSRSTVKKDNIPAGFPNHSIGQILDLLAQDPHAVDAYKAESALSVRSPIRSGSFSATIQHLRNDSLLISISPGLGIVAVRTLVTPDSFFIHNRIDKELTLGAIRDLQRLLPLPVSAEILYATMLGRIVPETNGNWILSSNNQYYFLKAEDNRFSYTIDPTVWRVVRYEERSPNDELVEERTFSEFESFDGMYLPRRLTFRRPGDDTAASLFYRKISINPTDLNLSFQVDASVPRLTFR